MSKGERAVRQLAEKYGLEVIGGTRHWKLRHPVHGHVGIMPHGKPSERGRHTKNLEAQLKRLLGK